jgi:Outer membrane protein beta-barrel domain
MIRKIATALTLGAMASAAPLTAQGIGLVAGVVSANITVDPPLSGTEVSSRTGFAGGLSLTIMSNKAMSLGAEGLYVQKGAKLKSGTVTGSEEFAYLEVPVLLHIKLGSGPMHPFLLLGAQYSMLLSCNQKISVTSDVDCKANDDIKSSDYGVMAGIGIRSGKLSLSVRYDLGLQDITKNPTTGDPTAKNKAIMAMVGVSM